MALNIKNFQRIVQDQAAAIQAKASALVDFTKGSILRAIIDANAGIAVWLESMAVYVLSLTRASTCQGTDLDTWMADYNFTRLPAKQSSGFVTFSRFTSDVAGFVPVGAIAMTEDRTQKFIVLADATNPAYDQGLGGFTIAIGISDLTVTVQSQNYGIATNVQTGSVNVIYGALTGIDTVINNASMTGGVDAESDDLFRARFLLYVASFSKGTKAAVGDALEKMRLGINYTITEGATTGGTPRDGYFYVVIDDGTGSPSDALVAAANSAVESVRALGITYGVFKPTILSVNVVMTLTIDSTYTPTDVKAIVGTAVSAYINALPLGSTLSTSKVAQVAYDASPGVLDVYTITLNAGTTNIVATKRQVIKTSSVTVN